MNSYSHIRIGRMVLRRLQSEYHVSLPSTVFLWANCRPDYSFKYKRIPHYKEPMNEIFAQLVNEISRCRWEKCELVFIADRLGVICHFLCDFFCYAHSPSFNGGITEHIRYESKLNRFLKEHRNLCEQWMDSDRLRQNQPDKGALLLLEGHYRDYLCQQTSVACDIQYSLEACVKLTSRLLAQIQQNSAVPIRRSIHHTIST